MMLFLLLRNNHDVYVYIQIWVKRYVIMGNGICSRSIFVRSYCSVLGLDHYLIDL